VRLDADQFADLADLEEQFVGYFIGYRLLHKEML
jgi:hypothetical protein